VKPDGVQKGLIGEIIKRLEQRNLKVVAIEMFQPTKEQVDMHYPKDPKWITRLGEKTMKTYNQYNLDAVADYGTDDPEKLGPMVRAWIIEYMTSAPAVKMVVEGLHAIDMVRKIVGPTSPHTEELGTIRVDFSNDSPALANQERRALFNLVHASETPEEAAHEIEFWFGKEAIFQYKRFGVDE
jgi:nucleoside-diphosphate kinase